MIRLCLILFAFSSCNVAKRTTSDSGSKTVTLDGSKSHAATGQKLVKIQWRDLNGTAKILNPGSLVTQVIVTRTTTFELWGKQTDGQTGRDSMSVIIK